MRAQSTSWKPRPVGEKQNQPFQLSFNPSLKVDFQGPRVTSDGGLLLVRELDERLGLSALIRKRHGRPARQEHSITAAGLAETVHVQSAGRIRGEGLWILSLAGAACVNPRALGAGGGPAHFSQKKREVGYPAPRSGLDVVTAFRRYTSKFFSATCWSRSR